MNKTALPWLTGLLLAAPQAAMAQPLCELPVTAYLTDGDGAPLTGAVDVELRFYDDDAPAALPSECRTVAGAAVEQGWLRLMVNTCAPPAAEDCGLAPLNSLLGAAGSGGLWVGVTIDGADELIPRLPVGAVPFALTARDTGLLDGSPASDFERTGTAEAAVSAHAGDPDAHHPADSGGINIRPASVEIGGTSLNEGELDFGPDADDAITAEITRTLTGGGNADSLHAHAAGPAVAGGVCYTAYGQTTCGEGFTAMYTGIATYAALVETNFGAGAMGSPVCLSSAGIASTSAGVGTWDGQHLVGMRNGETGVNTVDALPVT